MSFEREDVLGEAGRSEGEESMACDLDDALVEEGVPRAADGPGLDVEDSSEVGADDICAAEFGHRGEELAFLGGGLRPSRTPTPSDTSG